MTTYDLEGLWEINSIDIKDMDDTWWNSHTFRYIMTTLSLKKTSGRGWG
jgi:hypothetical protein